MTTASLVELEPGSALDHDDPLWQEAIVVVIAGELEVTCSRGESHSFCAGAVLTLARLPVLRARNSSAASTRLLAISR